MGTNKSVVPSPPEMDLYGKNGILASIIFVWLNVSSTKGLYDPYAWITFKEEKPTCAL
jgi:hypothetical protein